MNNLAITQIETIDELKQNRKSIDETVDILVNMIENGEVQEAECPVTHRFAPGCYLREIFMPKGTRVIGKIHATEHFNIILAGVVTVITADKIEKIKAPYTFISEAGVQKVVVIHEDCTWQTIHVTNSTDLDEI